MSDRDMEQSEKQPTAAGEGAQISDRKSADMSRASRRRFLTGGAAVAPVIMTLTSRPAQAGLNCTYSAWASAPGSLRDGKVETCMSRTPMRWKDTTDWPSNISKNSVKWSDLFGSAGPSPSKGRDALLIDILGEGNSREAECAAAFLNSAKWYSGNFSYSTSQIVSSWASQTPPVGGNYDSWLELINNAGTL